MSRSVALAAAATLTLVAPGASGTEHCVAHVVGQTADGELQLSEPVCIVGDDADRAALVANSISAIDAELASTGITTGIRLSGSVLGTHYDGVYSGNSITVTGTGSCSGGWINLSAYWSNRVSSTINGVCTRVKHHDHANKGGSYQSTWGWGGALSYMNNRANSISYEMA